MTDRIKIPKEFHSRIIGQQHFHHRNLENKYGVLIRFPSKNSRSSNVKITGSVDAIENVKEDLRKVHIPFLCTLDSTDIFKVATV